MRGRPSGDDVVVRSEPLDWHRLHGIGERESEEARVEVQLGLESALMLFARRKPCPSPSKVRWATGIPLRRSASAIISDWFGSTTLSSSPWKRMTGQDNRSVKWMGERARFNRERRSATMPGGFDA
jgi:hypothetical protein